MIVTIELARRLLVGGAVTPRDLEHAFLFSFARGLPFARALIDRGAITERALEEEIARFAGPALRQIAPAVEWVHRLPSSMCRRMGAVPIRFDASTQTVEIASIDPLDPHVAAEFAFQLGHPVRVSRATIGAIEEAIRRIELGEAEAQPARSRRRTPAFPHGAPKSSVPPPPADDVPIPLVRRVGGGVAMGLLDDAREDTTFDGDRVSVSFPSLPPPEGGEDMSLADAETVDAQLPPVTQHDHRVESRELWAAPSETFQRGFEHVEAPTRPSPEAAIERIGEARGRDALVEATLQAMETVARRVGVLAVKREGFYGVRCNRAFGDPAIFRQIIVPVDTPTIFATATAAGHYLGPVPNTPAHRSVLRALGTASPDLAVWVAKVVGKPALLLVADDLDDPLRSTRALERIAGALGAGLTRVLANRA